MKKIADTRVIVKRKTYCCDKKNLINDNQMYVCKNCGQIDRYKTKQEYIDFYKNKYKFRRESVYIRK